MAGNGHGQRKNRFPGFIGQPLEQLPFFRTPSGELEEIRPHVQRYIQDFECNIRPSPEEIEEIESEMQEFDPESEPPQELFTSSEMKRKEDLSDTREALMDSPYASQRFRSSIRELETTRRDLPELLMEKLSARFPE
ncbi:Protein of unknown function [Gryllus bimaculatus]|nr:Protein of unknown function [Gryllus bimaculatus]